MGNNLDALTTVFTEFYYWITLPLMFLIHVGFCMYEVGASRRRNHLVALLGVPEWSIYHRRDRFCRRRGEYGHVFYNGGKSW